MKAEIGTNSISKLESKERDRESESHSDESVKSEKSEVGSAHTEAQPQQGNRLQKSEQSSNAAATISQGQSDGVIREQDRSKAGVGANTARTESVARTTAVVATAGVATAGVFANVTDNVGERSGQSSSVGAFEHDPLDAPSTDPLSVNPEKPAYTQLSVNGRVTVAPTNVRHPWFVKMAISPDFSSIDYGSAGKTGINFGPMVEYGISPRFSISTGAIWSKKLYDQENPEKHTGRVVVIRLRQACSTAIVAS